MRVQRHRHSAGGYGGENSAGGHVQEHHATRFGDEPGHRTYHSGEMVRDFRATAAGLFVVTLAQTGVTNWTFDTGHAMQSVFA